MGEFDSALEEAIIFGHELEFVDEATAREMIGAKLDEIRLRRIADGGMDNEWPTRKEADDERTNDADGS